MKYEYGKAYEEYPVDDFTFSDGSRLKVHNIFNDTCLLYTSPSPRD